MANTRWDKIFPTHIFVVNDVLNKKDLDIIKKDVLNNYNTTQMNWQSFPNLQTVSTYNSLTEKVIYYSKNVFDTLHYKYDKFVITDMWSNVLKPGEMHRPHTHSNNILSGVFYVQSEKSSGITFYDPRPQSNVISPTRTKSNLDNASIVNYESLENRMILFPSWLQHYVPTNITKSNRISIAFNVMLKGKVGESKELQSSVF